MAPEEPAATNSPAEAQAPPAEKSCANCGAGMRSDQDWCLQCGAGTSSSLGSGGSWLSPVALLVATGALVLGAAAASYAAWGKSSTGAASPPVTVAQVPAPAASAPATVPPATTTTTAPPVKLPKTPIKPPKIPLTAATPKATLTTSTTTTSAASEGTTTTQTTTTSETLPEPILLDTNAASTYDPNNYPAGEFGDPTLAIDGDTSTGWTAQINPSLAPKLGAGLEIDLKAPQRISSAELITTTLGITVQVYGANVSGTENTAPATISDPAWVKLSKTFVVKKHHAHIKFLHPGQSYRFIVLWIRYVPASAVGTPEAPGRVSINELELFPAGE